MTTDTRWQTYQAATGEIVRARHEERGLLLHWLGIVEATSRDPYTMEYLEQRIVRGDWSHSLIYQARAIMAYGRAEEL